jgi:N-acetylmuramoyl-L-alanine amidase
VVAAGDRPFAGRTIHIDAGHNGANHLHLAEINRPVNIVTKTITCDTTGTAGGDGYTESAFNLDVALRLQTLLAAEGARVVMTRTSDQGWGPCVNERAAIANRAHADAAISIHADGNTAAGARGFHVLEPIDVPGYNDAIIAPSARLALDARNAFASTGMPISNYVGGGGIVGRNDLGGLNLSHVPKVFIECGNMRNATDFALLENAAWRERAAEAVAAALTRFLAGG